MKILIEGDSWPFTYFGDFTKVNNVNNLLTSDAYNSNYTSVAMPVLATIINQVEGITCHCNAQGGSNNDMVLHRLNKVPDDYDVVIVYQCQPIKNFNHSIHMNTDCYNENLKQILSKPLNEFESILNDMLLEYYQRLEDLRKTKFSNAKFYMIGGGSKVDADMLANVSDQIQPIITSICQHFIEKYNLYDPEMPPFVQHRDFTFANWANKVDDNTHETIINELYRHNELKKLYKAKLDRILWPDDCHPNANAQISIADLLLKQIEHDLGFYGKLDYLRSYKEKFL